RRRPPENEFVPPTSRWRAQLTCARLFAISRASIHRQPHAKAVLQCDHLRNRTAAATMKDRSMGIYLLRNFGRPSESRLQPIPVLAEVSSRRFKRISSDI